MPVDWTSHRFSGGVLALDVANTVVHRDRPELRFDRFDEAGEIARFARAVERFRTGELGGRPLSVAEPEEIKPSVVALREATDALFRDASRSGSLHAPKLEALLRAAADGLHGQSEWLGGRSAAGPASALKPLAFATALGFSALSLLEARSWQRIRICPACAWLFLDGSRNGSRRWCDMTVCGNRQKARLHYGRKRHNRGYENA